MSMERNKEMLENARKWAEEKLCPEELFLVQENLEIQKAFYKDAAGALFEPEVRVHVGTYQDSVLLVGPDGVPFDFRYFLRCGMEFYVWSECIRKIHLYNCGNGNLTFMNAENPMKKALCRQGEVTCLQRGEFASERVL